MHDSAVMMMNNGVQKNAIALVHYPVPPLQIAKNTLWLMLNTEKHLNRNSLCALRSPTIDLGYVSSRLSRVSM